MPAVSQAQFKFMAAVASGKIKRPGLTPDKAREFLDKSKGTFKNLPGHVKSGKPVNGAALLAAYRKKKAVK
jgi:hypothetical protein